MPTVQRKVTSVSVSGGGEGGLRLGINYSWSPTPESLEKLVRPSQVSSVRPNWRSNLKSAAKSGAPQPVELSWGGSGESIFSVVTPDPVGFKLEDDPKKEETDRQYDVVRVKNEDDPDQYVDTEVMTDWRGMNLQTGEIVQFKFLGPQNTKNTEVISRGHKVTSNAIWGISDLSRWFSATGKIADFP